MKEARNFEKEENLGHPTNQIYAIVQSRDLLHEIIQTLRAVSRPTLSVFCREKKMRRN
jgi:hypothetical protein